MTITPPDAPVPAAAPEAPAPAAPAVPAPAPPSRAARSQAVQPVLEQLFELYPQLFGPKFLPLKLGIFQELLASHPEQFTRDALKAALGVHTRSTRYLQCVAAGHPRHDLQGQPVEAVAPEHVYLTLLELFRRRQGRSAEDLRPKLRAQIRAAFEQSGLSRQDYLARVQTSDAEANTLLEEALEEHAQVQARQEALLRAFDSSGKTPAEFADMYGLAQRDVIAALERKRRQQSAAGPV